MPFNYLYNLSQKIRNRHFFIFDIIVSMLTPYLALFIRLDGNVDLALYGEGLIFYTIIMLLVKLSFYYFLGLYTPLWQTASIHELTKISYIGINAILIQIVLYGLLRRLALFDLIALPYSLPFLDGFSNIFIVSVSRFSLRLSTHAKERIMSLQKRVRVLIVGAGQAGSMVLKEMYSSSQLKLFPVAFVDDDQEKQGQNIGSVPIVGKIEDIPRIISDYKIEKIFVAMPLAEGQVIREIISFAADSDVEILTLPGIFEILGGRVKIEKMRKIQIVDLLRREPVKTDIKSVCGSLNGKKVLVTGAGGSIGSELCKQIIKFDPSEIILLGHGENSIFEIEEELNELKRTGNNKYGKVKLSAVIADIRFADRIETVFEKFHPEIIFHTAAHKHVPLMEANSCEAISNNILGTKILVENAVKFGVKNLILISTDKAVNPTSVMGVCKRIAEMIVLDSARMLNKNYCAVRFGNVLGSRGSVVKTFTRQIENGGPITLTHPDITRYFMTIPEAVQLVLQASVLGLGGEIFLLNMGEPIKIMDLAKDMINLAAYKSNEDIEIEITGLRPGEKLFEELFNAGEDYIETQHDKIFIAKNASEFIPLNFNENLGQILKSPNQMSSSEQFQNLSAIVPEFQPQNHSSPKSC